MKKFVEQFMTVGNGTLIMPTWISKLIMASVLGAACAGVGAWLGGINHGVATANVVNQVQDTAIKAVDQQSIARDAAITKELDGIQPKLDRIDDKLDALVGLAHAPRRVYVVQNPKEATPKPTPDEVLNGGQVGTTHGN